MDLDPEWLLKMAEECLQKEEQEADTN